MENYFKNLEIDRDSLQINVGDEELGFITYCEPNIKNGLGSFIIEILFFDEENIDPEEE